MKGLPCDVFLVRDLPSWGFQYFRERFQVSHPRQVEAPQCQACCSRWQEQEECFHICCAHPTLHQLGSTSNEMKRIVNKMRVKKKGNWLPVPQRTISVRPGQPSAAMNCHGLF